MHPARWKTSAAQRISGPHVDATSEHEDAQMLDNLVADAATDGRVLGSHHVFHRVTVNRSACWDLERETVCSLHKPIHSVLPATLSSFPFTSDDPPESVEGTTRNDPADRWKWTGSVHEDLERRSTSAQRRSAPSGQLACLSSSGDMIKRPAPATTVPKLRPCETSMHPPKQKRVRADGALYLR